MRGVIISYDEVRGIGFIEPDQRRRDGAAVRFTSKTSFEAGDEVTYEAAPYRRTAKGKCGPTARDVTLIEDRRTVETLYGADEYEPWGVVT